MPINLQYISKPGNTTPMNAFQWKGVNSLHSVPAWAIADVELFPDINGIKLILWRDDGFLVAAPNDYICLYKGGELFHLAPVIFNKCYQAATT